MKSPSSSSGIIIGASRGGAPPSRWWNQCPTPLYLIAAPLITKKATKASDIVTASAPVGECPPGISPTKFTIRIKMKVAMK